MTFEKHRGSSIWHYSLDLSPHLVVFEESDTVNIFFCQLSLNYLQIPQIFFELQTSVQAVLLGAVMETDWSTQGVPVKSLAEEWSISLPDGLPTTTPSDKEDSEVAAIAGDGQYLYVHGPFGLLKVGSGYGDTKKVCVCVCMCVCVRKRERERERDVCMFFMDKNTHNATQIKSPYSRPVECCKYIHEVDG